MKRNIVLVVVLCILVIVLSGCNKNIESITITEDKVWLTVGDTYQLSADFTPEGADSQDVEWISSNEKVATVKNGMVQTLYAGDAKITVKAPNGVESNICFIFVKDPPSAYDQLSQVGKYVYYILTDEDVLYENFKEPSTVTVRDVKEIVSKNNNGEEMTHGSFLYMTLGGQNGLGGTTVDSYVVSRNKVMSFEKFELGINNPMGYTFERFNSLSDIDYDLLNKALKDYYEKKGW